MWPGPHVADPAAVNPQEEDELLRSINSADFEFSDPGWKKLSKEALDMVSSLLRREPDDRFPLEEVPPLARGGVAHG